jgi:hypothetical protein
VEIQSNPAIGCSQSTDLGKITKLFPPPENGMKFSS